MEYRKNRLNRLNKYCEGEKIKRCRDKEKQQKKKETTAVGNRNQNLMGTKPKTRRAETEERWLCCSK